MNHEPVAQSLNSMRLTLEELAAMVRDPSHRDEIAAEEIRLGQIISRAQLILSFLDTFKPQKRWWRNDCKGKTGMASCGPIAAFGEDEMTIPSVLYSGSLYIVRHVDIKTGNYVHTGPFDDVIEAANYISHRWTSVATSEEPTLIKLDRKWYDTDEGTIEGDDPNGDYYGNIGC